MNIIAINGSPRKEGNTSQIVSEIIKGARKNKHDCEIIYLAELNIKDCTGCGVCKEKRKCVYRDDIEKIEEAILKADLIIWASPTHWTNVSAYMQRVFERLCGFFIEPMPRRFPLKRNAKGKKAILVTSCFAPWPINWIFNISRSCINRMRAVCKFSGQKVINTFVLSGTTLTMKEISEKHLTEARNIGKQIK
ncbi:MAG: flavodoxin family protein [Patescibacteria group bacterium]